MIHKKESSVGALLEFYPEKRKTTAAITSAQIKKVSRELGSAAAGSFARLLPSKICTRPSAVHAARSCARSLPSPPYTVLHSLRGRKVKSPKRCCCYPVMSVAKPRPGGRSHLSVAMVQPAQYSCSTVLTRCLASSIQAAHQKRSNPLSQNLISHCEGAHPTIKLTIYVRMTQ